MARRWIKVWVGECLTGTIRFDFTPEERSVWYDLLVLAGNCRQEGLIAAGKACPYPHSWIAGTLNIPQKLLDRTLTKCETTERIIENGDGIRILNWDKYQSEYERQKPYRDKARSDEEESCPPETLEQIKSIWAKTDLSQEEMALLSTRIDGTHISFWKLREALLGHDSMTALNLRHATEAAARMGIDLDALKRPS